MPLKGKTVFITGGTGGIGVPLVAMLEKAGAKVDVYSSETDGDLVANIERTIVKLKEDTPDILINMAGYNVLGYCEDQDIDAIVALNMMVPIRLTQAVLPVMKKRNNGQIVNIGSMTALIPLPHLSGYVAAKAGLKGFNDALRRELGGTQIKLTHIIPRAVKTKMNTGVKAEVNKRTGVNHDAPEDIAKQIFNAIINEKKEVRIGWPERLFAFINANLPCIIDKGLQKNRKIGEDVLDQYHERKAS